MYLGIDLGRKKTGLAISEGTFASPYKIITHKSIREAIERIVKELETIKAETVIIGYTEGKNKKYFENFKDLLQANLPKIKIVMWEETLTTRQARQTMVKLHIPQRKKAKKEDAIAASIILQEYLDSK